MQPLSSRLKPEIKALWRGTCKKGKKGGKSPSSAAPPSEPNAAALLSAKTRNQGTFDDPRAAPVSYKDSVDAMTKGPYVNT